MKNLFKIYLFVFIAITSSGHIYARRLVIANIGKPLKPDSAYTTIGVDASLDVGGTQANAVPIPIGTPGYSVPTSSQIAQLPRTVGCLLDINYMEFGVNKKLNRVVSACAPFHQRCNASYKKTPATFENFTNNSVVFTFTNKVHKTFFQCFTGGAEELETKAFKFTLDKGYDPVYLLITNDGVKKVTKQQMDNAISTRNCH